jgi:hypothetical protein
MNTIKFQTVSAAAILAAAGGLVHGQTIAYDGFAYAPGMPLSATGMGGTGWATTWNPAAPGDWLIDSIGSSYHSGGWSLVRSGLRLRGTQAGMQRTMSVSPPIGNTAGTVWVSFIAQQVSASPARSWLGVKLPCVSAAGVNAFLFLGKPWDKPNWGTDAGSIALHRQTGVPATTRAFIVARIDLRPGPDDVHLWVNPPLTATPATATASLALPAYGNFEGITKAIVEVGSTSVPIAGHLDELRIGRDYRSVAPLRDGVFFQGRNVIPLGNAQTEFVGDTLHVTNLGSPSTDGVQIAIDSIGHELVLDVGVLEPGQRFSATHRTTAGELISKQEFHRDAQGVTTLLADFRGVLSPDLLSVRGKVYDGAGSIAQEFVVPDFAGEVVIPDAILDPPCPDGTPRRWYASFEGGGPGSPPFTVIWYYGCGERGVQLADPSTLRNCVVFNLEFDATGPSGTGDETLMVLQSDTDDFSILRTGGRFHHLPAVGFGDVELSEKCSDGTSCPDPNARELTIEGDGGVNFDLFGAEPVTSVEARVRTFNDPATPAIGQHEFRVDGADTLGDPASVGLSLRSDGLGGGALDVIAEGATVCRYTITDNGVPIISWLDIPQGLPVETYSWVSPWVKFWCQVGSTRWGLSAQFENYFTMQSIPGGGSGTGNGLIVEIWSERSSTVAFNFGVFGENNPGPIVVADLDTNTYNRCSADFNQDGFLDFFDYDEFVGAFETGDPRTDFNLDGFLDFFDYDAFVQAFEIGC